MNSLRWCCGFRGWTLRAVSQKLFVVSSEETSGNRLNFEENVLVANCSEVLKLHQTRLKWCFTLHRLMCRLSWRHQLSSLFQLSNSLAHSLLLIMSLLLQLMHLSSDCHPSMHLWALFQGVLISASLYSGFIRMSGPKLQHLHLL